MLIFCHPLSFVVFATFTSCSCFVKLKVDFIDMNIDVQQLMEMQFWNHLLYFLVFCSKPDDSWWCLQIVADQWTLKIFAGKMYFNYFTKEVSS